MDGVNGVPPGIESVELKVTLGAELVDAAPWVPWLLAAIAFWAVSTQIGIGNRFFEPMTVTQYLERHYLYAAVAFGVVLPAVVGTPGPTCATAMLWKASSENRGVSWQSTQAHLPTKSCAPRRALSSMTPEFGPAATKASNGVPSWLTSKDWYASRAMAQFARTRVTAS